MEKTCPKCGYTRKPTDEAPDWQCPQCGVAYEKAALSQGEEIRARLKAREQAEAAAAVREQQREKEKSKPPKKGYWESVLEFRVMASPGLLRVVFVLGLVAIVIGAIGEMMKDPGRGFAGLFIGPIVWRVMIELLILPFRIHEALEEIRGSLASEPAE
ncbi:DUF4282 domain-containing protein [Endothiovibrio diazotrophicus]